MTPEFHALWILCALGATSFAAAAAARPRRALVLAAGALAGVLATTPARLPDAVVVATGAGAVAALHLVRPRWGAVTAFAAGVLGAVWCVLMQVQGVPGVAAIAAGAALPLLAMYLASRRSSFAPPALRDEALLLILLGSIVVAAAPGVMGGWRAAFNLNVVGQEGPGMAVPWWIAMFGVASMAGGGLYSLWSRR